jgi:hypothetical protein
MSCLVASRGDYGFWGVTTREVEGVIKKQVVPGAHEVEGVSMCDEA